MHLPDDSILLPAEIALLGLTPAAHLHAPGFTDATRKQDVGFIRGNQSSQHKAMFGIPRRERPLARAGERGVVGRERRVVVTLIAGLDVLAQGFLSLDQLALSVFLQDLPQHESVILVGIWFVLVPVDDPHLPPAIGR